MTRQRVADDQYGKLHRRLADLVRRVDEGGLPFDATMEGLQALIEGRRFERKQDECLLGNCIIYVDYDMPCEQAKLEASFLADIGDVFYRPEDYPWTNHPSCIRRARNEKAFVLVKFSDWGLKWEDAVARINDDSWRVATHLEAFAWARSKPDLSAPCQIVALGSYTRAADGTQRFAVLDMRPGRLAFGYGDFERFRKFPCSDRWLLAVEKAWDL